MGAKFPLQTWALLTLFAACIAARSDAQTIERGPYLQSATPTGTVVRWRTDQSVDGVVRFGTTSDNLTQSATGPIGTEHEVQLSGLQPDTRFFYSVGTSSGVIAGDATYTFTTGPPTGIARPTRVWVVGDSGTANSDARAVRDAYLNYTGGRGTDMWLMLGDNAYSNGTDQDYQSAVFDTYPELLRQAVVWPTLGNHDGRSASSASQTGPYYEIFTLPKNAEAGGLASGTEAYYSFDRSNIHFVVLDSYDSDRSVNSTMLTWLENNLAANQQEWLIAFWHHPPYSKGSHDSDDERILIQMRENVLPLLESYGVDLVLSGHSHSYERSYLIDQHYGSSSTFDSSMLVDSGTGREDDTGAYAKSVPGAANQGAVYAVAGSSGKTSSSGSLDHPAMVVSLRELGSMVLDINGLRLDAVFLDDAGNVLDYFTLRKEGSSEPDTDPPTSPVSLQVTTVTSDSISLAWAASTDNIGVTGYRVQRDGQGLATVSTTNFTDFGLQTGTTYTYSVSAFDAAGNSSVGISIDATTEATNVAVENASGSGPSDLFLLVGLALLLWRRKAISA